jgi:hypothetical protein
MQIESEIVTRETNRLLVNIFQIDTLSGVQNAADSWKEVFSSLPPVGMTTKYPGVGGLFVTMAMDDDISCPLLEDK